MGDLTKLSLDDVTSSLNVLETLGVEPHHWARLRSDALFARRMAGAFRCGGRDLRDSRQGLPYDGRLSFFGPEDWEYFFGVALTPTQWEVARHFPWPDIEYDKDEPSRVKANDKWVGGQYFAFLGVDDFYEFDERWLNPRDDGWLLQHHVTLDGLNKLLRPQYPGRYDQWQRPKLSWPRVSMSGVNRLDWLGDEPELRNSAPKLRWYLLLIHPFGGNFVAGRFHDRDRRRHLYERPSAVELNLGLLLYYQKYGNWPRKNSHHEPGKGLLWETGDKPNRNKAKGVLAGCRLLDEYGNRDERLVVEPIERGNTQAPPIARMRKLPPGVVVGSSSA